MNSISLRQIISQPHQYQHSKNGIDVVVSSDIVNQYADILLETKSYEKNGLFYNVLNKNEYPHIISLSFYNNELLGYSFLFDEIYDLPRLTNFTNIGILGVWVNPKFRNSFIPEYNLQETNLILMNSVRNPTQFCIRCEIENYRLFRQHIPNFFIL